MSRILQAVRGMNDLLPDATSSWRQVEKAIINLSLSYGYQEIRFPIVEKTELFKRSIGDETDIVTKEMYTFDDRNGDSLTLRPEGTAVCVRACLQHGLLYNQTQRLWYMGPMFRHERPQKGRYRQFYQFGLEAFGFEGVDVEIEQLLLIKRLWQVLGLDKQIRLELNTIGEHDERQQYITALKTYLEAHRDQLDADSVRRLETNPLRILDSKSESVKAVLKNAPTLADNLSEATVERFDRLCQTLETLGIDYEVNPYLVRGLDYYSHTVFEWVTDALGAQGTVCAGGRYDRLIEQCGGKPTYAVGCALGIERLVLLYQMQKDSESRASDVYVAIEKACDFAEVALEIEKLRRTLPLVKITTNLGQGSLKSQFKKADKSGASMVVLFAKDELSVKEVVVKPLREDKEQVRMSINALANYIKTELGEA